MFSRFFRKKRRYSKVQARRIANIVLSCESGGEIVAGVCVLDDNDNAQLKCRSPLWEFSVIRRDGRKIFPRKIIVQETGGKIFYEGKWHRPIKLPL